MTDADVPASKLSDAVEAEIFLIISLRPCGATFFTTSAVNIMGRLNKSVIYQDIRSINSMQCTITI
jgi:hypothetical protein